MHKLNLPLAFREQFPALANKTYFNFGGQGLLPQVALSAIIKAFEEVQRDGPFSVKMSHWLQDQLDMTRQALSKEFGGEAHCYAITQNVTEACNIAMWGLTWQNGDNLLITDCEHPSISDTSANLAARQGLELRVLPVKGQTTEQILESLSQLIDARTRLFAFSHVLWNTGVVLDIQSIANLCRAKGVLTLADGAQSAGAMALNLVQTGVDFYAVTGHKWLCGPEGTGCLYIAPAQLDKLQPTYMGWRHHMTGTTIGAERFEIATSAFPLLAGWREALALHQSAGDSAQRHAQIIDMSNYLKEELTRIGAQVIPSNRLSGLTSFTLPGKNHHDLSTALDSKHIMIRSIPEPECLRASVHYFTSQHDVDLLIKALTELKN